MFLTILNIVFNSVFRLSKTICYVYKNLLFCFKFMEITFWLKFLRHLFHVLTFE